MAGVRQVSFQVSHWPRPDDLARYHEQLGVPPEAIIRDIVRIVSVAQLVHDGVLGEDWVLSGGMGMRLRGSTRFTMSDTDTSRRGGAPDRDELADAPVKAGPSSATGRPATVIVNCSPPRHDEARHQRCSGAPSAQW
jgi:hypothetical protein